jgi:DNA-binding transcriptional regulator LsrR (DeoR family)
MKPNIRSQRRKVQDLLSSPNPDGLTRMQVAKCLGIERASVCRRVDELRKAGVLWVIRKGPDPITGERAEFLTTNKEVAQYSCYVPEKDRRRNNEKTGNLFGQ